MSSIASIINPLLPGVPSSSGALYSDSAVTSNSTANTLNSAQQVLANPTQQSTSQLIATQAIASVNKANLPPFELTSAPWNTSAYTPVQAENSTNSADVYFGWNLLQPLESFINGNINTKFLNLVSTQINSSLFYITEIAIDYFSPDMGVNNYYINVNGSMYPTFSNFRNFTKKNNPEGYFINGASTLSIAVSSVSGYIQPVVVTVIGNGLISQPLTSGNNSNMPSYLVMA